MNVKIIYHSLTGNTAKLANAIADALNIKAEPVGKEAADFSKPADLLFIGDGIYFGKANKKILSLIDKLNPDIVKNIAVFATYGGMARIGDDIKKYLQEKGFHVIGKPFTCRGKAWLFFNRSHPDNAELNKVREFAKDAVAAVNDKK